MLATSVMKLDGYHLNRAYCRDWTCAPINSSSWRVQHNRKKMPTLFGVNLCSRADAKATDSRVAARRPSADSTDSVRTRERDSRRARGSSDDEAAAKSMARRTDSPVGYGRADRRGSDAARYVGSSPFCFFRNQVPGSVFDQLPNI